MSDKPKKSFLSTLGKHVGLDPTSLPPAEPQPPGGGPGPAATPAAKDTEAAATAAREKAEAEAKQAQEAKAAADQKAKEEAEAKRRAAPEPKPSEPLPPLEESEFAPAPKPEPTPETKPATTLLGYRPSRVEVRYLETLQAAADRNPEKYQAVLDAEVDRLNKLNQFKEKWETDNPGEELTGDNPEYRRFLKANPPAIDDGEFQDIRDEQIAERAKQSAKKELQEEMEPKLRKVTEMEAKPEIERAEKEIDSAILAALPEAVGQDDYLMDVAKDGVAALAKVPVEGKIVHAVVTRGKELTGEFLRLRRGLVPFDPNNQDHVFISRSIATEAEAFEKQGGDDRMRNGKRFVTPATYAKLTPAARTKHWTFEDSDVVQRFAQTAARVAVTGIQNYRAEEAERDKLRKPKTPPGKPDPAPAPVASSPALAPTPAGSPTPKPAVKNPFLRQTLGLPAK